MSKFGFAFMPRTYPGNVVEALDIKVPTISTRSGSFAKLKSLLFQLYKSKAPFTVLQQENDSENATYFGVLDSPTPKPDKYGHSFDFKVFTQNWRPRTLTRVVNEPPSLVITADNQNPAAGVSVAYTSTTVDPQGTAVTMLWEWSDDFTSVLDNPTRSFLEEGTYLLTATATNAGGASTSRTMLMEVGKPNTYRLVAEANGGVGSPFALNTAIYVEVQLHDSDGQVLVQDSTTQLIAVPEGNLTVDLDQNGIFSVYPDDIGPRVFEQGEIFLDVKTAVAGTYDLTLIDTFGNQVVIPITFA
jgi:PKD repeat protein